MKPQPSGHCRERAQVERRPKEWWAFVLRRVQEADYMPLTDPNWVFLPFSSPFSLHASPQHSTHLGPAGHQPGSSQCPPVPSSKEQRERWPQGMALSYLHSLLLKEGDQWPMSLVCEPPAAWSLGLTLPALVLQMLLGLMGADPSQPGPLTLRAPLPSPWRSPLVHPSIQRPALCSVSLLQPGSLPGASLKMSRALGLRAQPAQTSGPGRVLHPFTGAL